MSDKIKLPACLEKPRIVELVTFDNLLELVGGFGRYQIAILIAILGSEIPAAFVAFSPIFVALKPDKWGCTWENVTRFMSVAAGDDVCLCPGEIKVDTPGTSIVSEWDLMCNGTFLPDFITSMQMLGMLVGAIITSQISDWYGRKKTYLLVCFLMAAGQLASGGAMSPWSYAFSRFLAGAGLAGFMGVSTIYPMEFLTPKWRSLCGSVGPWGEGIMLLALLASRVTQWRNLMWLSTMPFAFVLLSYPFLPESPRWLLRNKKTEEALKVLESIHKANHEECTKFPLTVEMLESVTVLETESDPKVRFSYLDFFREREIRRKTLYLMGIWFSWSLVYYGISYNINNLRGNVYFNVMMMGAVDAISYKFALTVNDRLGRRVSLVIFMLIGTVFLISLAASELLAGALLDPRVIVTLCLLGKFGVAAARSSARCLTGESFPTNIRTMGYGISGITAGVGGILAPQLAFIGSKWWHPLPFLAFAAVSVGGSALSLLLPETQGKFLTERVSGEKSKAKTNYGSVSSKI